MPSATEIPSQDPPLSYTASSHKWLTYGPLPTPHPHPPPHVKQQQNMHCSLLEFWLIAFRHEGQILGKGRVEF